MPSPTSWLNYLLISLMLLGVLLLFWHSTLRRNLTYSSFILLALLGINAGVMFYVLHLTGARLILLGGGLLLIITYALWFRRKPDKVRLDYLKLCWIVALGLFSIVLGSGLREALPYSKGLLAISFWLMLLDFLYSTYIRRPTSTH
ncbi:hypothetical protein DNI29_07285 [Hymenobacter sediminis]|uniref:hypothetical protein n=1 Tax=Hymenobacter sediminis TaxID=2218621 RepID=UPI000DA6B243|nr:hypothetical protein [Hymenobacter sediminis]RPD48421.1 hypothetical protein DNI29_07285 [Hymenobacter sediminis]